MTILAGFSTSRQSESASGLAAALSRMYGTEFNGDIGYKSGGLYIGVAYGVLFPFAAMSHPDDDDPNTPAREAFDAPLSSGLDEWVQGVNFKKVVTNSNLNSSSHLQVHGCAC